MDRSPENGATLFFLNVAVARPEIGNKFEKTKDMKLFRYGPKGSERPGLVDKTGILRDLSGTIDDLSGEFLGDAGLERLRELDWQALPKVPDDARFGPSVGGVGKFIGIGLNYSDHAAETGMSAPEEAVIFMKATSSICGPNDPVVLPPAATKGDWEVELGVVIGKACINIAEDGWEDHVAGYCVVNDVSERAYQMEGTGQWVKGKSLDSFGPVGPFLVTRDEVPDPQQLSLWLDLDGNRMQNGNTENMIFGVAHLVSYVSRFMSLHPGDIITTGTPAGVGFGRKPQVFLEPGQVMELGVEGLGSQRQEVIGAA
jgi:2-keto-4-pentenoate hydratase/2-oxohepta-3-ene-1,7-dioic acid hydratase in catechol pathway